jgi:peptide/nickel transport system permease protein
MHWISNIVVLLLVLGVVWLTRVVGRSRFWRESAVELWRRRRVAISAVGIFVLIALLDSISWIGSGGSALRYLSIAAVVLLALGALRLGRSLANAGLRHGSAIELFRRHRQALLVGGALLLVALLDPISRIGGPGEGLAVYQPRTIIDRIFRPDVFNEASYSAPFAKTAFYGGQPLRYPGAHALGTDILGRDVVYRALKGVRVALLIGVFTSLIVIPLALLFGVSAGYFGRRIDDAVFFTMTVLASVPSLLLLIALIMALGKGTLQVCVALGVTGWVSFCRLARAETFKLREADYVAAARALGVSDLRIIVRHILPNLAHLVIITFALTFTGLVLTETILSYLGIGIDGSWGQMIDQARNELSRTPIIWWNITAASVLLFALVLAVNTIADAMRDIADPRTRKEAQ